ncbi:ester cyclase [Candidatus Magnetominusculus xianensis]|uniref:Ester cyclase n=1 Tax=Candidatus Magnetominusculus xianensis TaxID=1748249 RepID=A0ABR5SHP2_9BACT|nr:ester cyclase [Candidatus Magnetominusculus xianensis]KWT89819.1 putative ester cyclase [Candidatus Magnetominusculus xianensis]MBF0404606.1 ester cyclase [Nitrospirota bacterium]
MQGKEDLKSIIKLLWDEAWSKGNLDVLDKIIDERCVNHISGYPDLQGTAGLRHFITQFRTSFPDIIITVEDQIEEDGKVANRWIAKGTHRGELKSIPSTGKFITVVGITIYRFENSKGIEAWTSWDDAGLTEQLKK